MKNGIRGVVSASDDGVWPIDDPDDYAGCVVREIMTIRDGATDIALRLDQGMIQFEPDEWSAIVKTSGLKYMRDAKLLGIDHLLDDGKEIQTIVVQTDKGWMRINCCSLKRDVPVKIGINHLGCAYVQNYKPMKQDRGVT